LQNDDRKETIMIEFKDLTKIYKLNKKQQKQMKISDTTKIAVENLSLTANEGEIFGLLGTNGAGKTTALRCLATLLVPTRGSVSVNGFDTVKDAVSVRENIGFLTNEIKLDPQFSPRYLMGFFGRLHGMNESEVEVRREELFAQFGITEFQDKKIEELSTGMKQKAAIAVSLIHDPKVIIFDEPTNGLDIITARAVTDYLQKLKEQGKTIIMSTHIMSEAEKLCDRIAIIIEGKLTANGTLAEILAQTDRSDLEDAFFTLYQKHGKAV